MATFVLVHGATLGGWSWQRLTPLLRAAGHEVYAPTLSGLGDRAHLLTPEVGLLTHVRDIADLLFYEDLHGAVLVGHSYGGVVITGAAEREAARVERLIYLDGLIPEDGRSGFAMMPAVRASWEAQAIEVNGARARAPYSRDFMAGVWGITDPGDLDWLEARLTPMPFRTNEEGLQLRDSRAARLPRSYIWCSGGPQDGAQLRPFAETARARGWDLHELPKGHLAPVTSPRELAALLLGIGAGAGATRGV